jgi:membrane protein YqaA with SNARE-associated domain
MGPSDLGFLAVNLIAYWRHLADTFMSWGAPGLFILALLDSTGLPVIGGVDALLIALAVNQPSIAYFAALCAIGGSLAGNLILFGIARKGGEALLAKHISSRRGKMLHNWFERYGLVTVFIPALSPIPMPMKIPVFCAGALEVRWTSFIGVVVAARTIRYVTLAYLALTYGRETFHFLTVHGFAVATIAGTLAIATLIVLRLINRRVQVAKTG